MPLVPGHIKELEPYKPGKSIQEIKKEYNPAKIIKLGSNENPIGTSPKAITAIKSSLTRLNRYPSPVNSELRMMLANRFDVDINNVITGHGSEGIMSVIIRTLMLDDEEALTADATFIGFKVLAKSRGIKLKTVPLKDYRFDLQAIADAITSKTKIIYLANPNNPTGTIFTVKEFLNFIKHVPEKALIILDEAYFEFCYEEPTFPDSMKYRLDNVITLRTFSKAYGLAGIRIGYGFAHENLIKNLMKVKLPFEPSIPASAAGMAAMDDEEFLDNYIKMNEQSILFFYDTFNDLGLEYIKSYANFVTLIFDSEDIVNKINEKLLKNGVIVRPLKAFGLPNCIRVSTGLPEENDYLVKTLKKIL